MLSNDDFFDHLFSDPYLVVHAYQLHPGKVRSHLAIQSSPSTVSHLITMATLQKQPTEEDCLFYGI
jgi:hypothetical protein